jgi:hypothetical protein
LTPANGRTAATCDVTPNQTCATRGKIDAVDLLRKSRLVAVMQSTLEPATMVKMVLLPCQASMVKKQLIEMLGRPGTLANCTPHAIGARFQIAVQGKV